MNLRTFFSLFLAICCVTLFVSEGSAATGKVPMGTWKSDNTTKQTFESAKLLPNHTYYYSGSVNGPECLIAIDNKFKLKESPIWAKHQEMSEKVLHDWIQSFKTSGSEASSIQGGVILTPDGKQAGIWYSHYPVNIVEMPAPGVVNVYQPHPIGGQHPGQTN